MNNKRIVVLLFTISLTMGSFAQSKNEREKVKIALEAYYAAFYDGNLKSFTTYFSKDIVKYGYWKGESNKYVGEPMSYEKMRKYVQRIDAEGNEMDVSIRDIKLFDVLKTTASAKLKFWWGYDYILLNKEKGRWKIRMVLWEGPLEN